jgi:hypothetical protein
LQGTVEVSVSPETFQASIRLDGMVFESFLRGRSALELIQRPASKAGNFMLFAQQGLEARARNSAVKINGGDVPLIFLQATISGGPAAV